jgi:ribonucleoside-diphosphate reductase subunit M2
MLYSEGQCLSRQAIWTNLKAYFLLSFSSLLENKLPEKRVKEIVCAAVDIERVFVCEALSCDLVGMNSKLMSEYVSFVADRLLVKLPPILYVQLQFDFML